MVDIALNTRMNKMAPPGARPSCRVCVPVFVHFGVHKFCTSTLFVLVSYDDLQCVLNPTRSG